MVSNYDPSLPILREMLALSIIAKLDDCGFTEFGFDDQTREKVYSRKIPETGISVNVYTTIVDREVRETGKDAIRVCAVYHAKDGTQRGIVKSTRIHRTGNIEDIVERMYTRMRETWKSAVTGKKCKSCGAPKFTAKSGKDVCAEICWLTPEQKESQNQAWKFKQAAKRHTRRNRNYYGRSARTA